MTKLHEPGERPASILKDASYVPLYPLYCNGNGMRAQAHAPTCPIRIPQEAAIFIARWETTPELTVHCKACRDHFFAANQALPLEKTGREREPEK